MWSVDMTPGKRLPSFPSVSLKQVEKHDSGANEYTILPLSYTQRFRPRSAVFSFGKSSLPLTANPTHEALSTLALIFNPLLCEVAF